MKVESGLRFLKRCLKTLKIESAVGSGQSKTGSSYRLEWVTDNLAVGYAPMSYADLDEIKKKGIDAIINLCAEYCDLHEIEGKTGFEVYYLPILDEDAPDMEEMEKALDWLDEAISVGKKILVHCRFGIGRTGTFVTAYLVKKGNSLKVAEKKMKHTCSSPESYKQWKLLRKYVRKKILIEKGVWCERKNKHS